MGSSCSSVNNSSNSMYRAASRGPALPKQHNDTSNSVIETTDTTCIRDREQETDHQALSSEGQNEDSDERKAWDTTVSNDTVHRKSASEAKSKGKMNEPVQIRNEKELEEAMKRLAVPAHDWQSALKLLKEHPKLFQYLKTALESVLYMHDPNPGTALSYLENLNFQFFDIDIKDRVVLGDFLGHVKFSKSSLVRYKSILRSAGLEYFNDTLLADVKKIPEDVLQIVFMIRSHWWNFSDASTVFGAQLATEGITQELVQDIVNLIGTDGKQLKLSFVFESAMGTLHNCAKIPNLRQTFRELKFVDTLGNFLNYEDYPKVTMLVLMTLALIIDENQTHLLTSHDSVFDLILLIANRAWKMKDHRYDGFSVEELIQSMTGLSRNDAVKKVLVQKGVLKLVLSVLTGGDEKEIEGAAKLLWELSFDSDNKSKIQQNEALMTAVNDLSKNANRRISRATQGVLWVIGMENKKDESKESEKESKTLSSKEGNATTGHIMLSYNWGDQKKLIEIRDVLRSLGYKVWMDIDNISGSTLQAMAEAVEQSAVVLVCMSEKYKESPNCRSEAEYAFSLKKPIIPLLMQFGYKPDGWLGILLGTKIFFDFSGKYPFEMKRDELMKEIGDRGQMKQDGTDGAIVKEAAAAVGKSLKAQPSSQLNVMDWISQNSLAKYACLRSLSSEHLQFLKKLSSRAPEFYYSFMLDLLSGKVTADSLTGLMMITSAVERIPR